MSNLIFNLDYHHQNKELNCNNELKIICSTNNINTIKDTIRVQATKKNSEKKKDTNIKNNGIGVQTKKRDAGPSNYNNNNNNIKNNTIINDLGISTFNNKTDIRYGINENVSEVQGAIIKGISKSTFEESIEILIQEKNNFRTKRSRNNNHYQRHHQQKCNIHRGHKTIQDKFDVFCLTCYRERVSRVNANCSIMEKQPRASEWI